MSDARRSTNLPKKSEKKTGGTTKKILGVPKKISVGTKKKKFWGYQKKNLGVPKKKFWGYPKKKILVVQKKISNEFRISGTKTQKIFLGVSQNIWGWDKKKCKSLNIWKIKKKKTGWGSDIMKKYHKKVQILIMFKKIQIFN